MKTKWQQVGVIGVDAGICWIGDPCYLTGDHNPPAPFTDWTAFCNKLNVNVTQFNYAAGHVGLGVVVSTGYGDGEYPVEAKIIDGRVKEVRVKFF